MSEPLPRARTEDPDLDAKRFRITERGICLITQSMIDGLAT